MRWKVNDEINISTSRTLVKNSCKLLLPWKKAAFVLHKLLLMRLKKAVIQCFLLNNKKKLT